MSNRRFLFSGSGNGERLKFYPNMKAIIAEKLSRVMITFRKKYYPKGWRFFRKTGGLTLLSRTIPELPLHPARK